MADHAGLRRAAGLGELVEQDRGQRVVRPGQRDAVIIEHALPGQRTHRIECDFLDL